MGICKAEVLNAVPSLQNLPVRLLHRSLSQRLKSPIPAQRKRYGKKHALDSGLATCTQAHHDTDDSNSQAMSFRRKSLRLPKTTGHFSSPALRLHPSYGLELQALLQGAWNIGSGILRHISEHLNRRDALWILAKPPSSRHHVCFCHVCDMTISQFFRDILRITNHDTIWDHIWGAPQLAKLPAVTTSTASIRVHNSSHYAGSPKLMRDAATPRYYLPRFPFKP